MIIVLAGIPLVWFKKIILSNWHTSISLLVFASYLFIMRVPLWECTERLVGKSKLEMHNDTHRNKNVAVTITIK